MQAALNQPRSAGPQVTTLSEAYNTTRNSQNGNGNPAPTQASPNPYIQSQPTQPVYASPNPYIQSPQSTQPADSSVDLTKSNPVQVVEPSVKEPPSQQQPNQPLTQDEMALMADLMQRQFGVTLDQAQQLSQQFQQDPEAFGRQNAISGLSTTWGITPTQVEERLTTLSNVYGSLDFVVSNPDHWGSPEGVQQLWQMYTAAQPATAPTTVDRPTNLMNQSPTVVSYDFKTSDIHKMTPAQRSANHQAIVWAYANGRVLMDQ